jgi:hypothetical protein
LKIFAVIACPALPKIKLKLCSLDVHFKRLYKQITLCQVIPTKKPHKINILCGFLNLLLTAFAKASAVDVVPTGIEPVSKV